MNTLFKNVYLITMEDGKAPIKDGCIFVRGDTIAYAGIPEGLPNTLHANEVIDAQGHVAMPGFINTHTHLPMTLFRGIAEDVTLQAWLSDVIWPMEAKLDDEAVYWGTMLAMAESIRGGVTTVNDQYFFHNAVAKAVRQSGMRAILGRGLADMALGGAEKLEEAIEFYNTYNGSENGRIQISMSPHAEYTNSLPFLEDILEAARRLNAPIHTHISETRYEHEECKKKYGMTPLALFDKLGYMEGTFMAAHCVWVEASDMELMKEKGVGVLHNPGSNLKIGSGVAPIEKMRKMGITIGLGTDGAASNNNLSLWEEMALCANVQKGVNLDPTAMPTEYALRMATLGGAEAMGLQKTTGTIEAGKKADIILIDTDQPHYYPRADMRKHIVYSGNASDVRLTMIDGRIVYRDGRYLTVDIEQLYHNVNKAVKKLRS